MKLRRRELPVVKAGFASPLIVEKELRSSFVTDAVRHVVTRFNELVTKLLLEGAIDAIEANEDDLGLKASLFGNGSASRTALSPKLSSSSQET
ncbi:hypothetical protein YC2023_023572 [Brassica napus]